MSVQADDNDSGADVDRDPISPVPDNRYFLMHLLKYLDPYLEAVDWWVKQRAHWHRKAWFMIERSEDLPQCELSAPELYLPPEVVWFLPRGTDEQIASLIGKALVDHEEIRQSEPDRCGQLEELRKRDLRLCANILQYIWPHRALRMQVWTRLQQLDFRNTGDEGPRDLVPLPDARTVSQMAMPSLAAEIVDLVEPVTHIDGALDLTCDVVMRTITRRRYSGKVSLWSAPAEWFLFWTVFSAGEHGLQEYEARQTYRKHFSTNKLKYDGSGAATRKVNRKLRCLKVEISDWKLRALK